MLRLRVLLPAVLLLLASACAGAAGGAATAAPYRSSDVITPEQVRQSAAGNAYDLVQRLRPRWLRTRGAVSMSGVEPVRVYRDMHEEGLVDSLKRIAIADVEWMEWVSGPQAQQRWGVGHSSGAIVVHSSGAPPVSGQR